MRDEREIQHAFHVATVALARSTPYDFQRGHRHSLIRTVEVLAWALGEDDGTFAAVLARLAERNAAMVPRPGGDRAG
jgi:hypothetical protein